MTQHRRTGSVGNNIVKKVVKKEEYRDGSNTNRNNDWKPN
jgi:hypothetical protein